MSSKNLILSCGTVCIVDEEDFEILNRHKWRLVGAGYVSRNSVKLVTKRQKTIYLHKILLDCPDGYEVDHINKNKLDNRKANLQICDRKENCRKRPKCKRTKHQQSSIYKGVSKHQGKWRARIFYNNKEISLGRFDCEIEAAKSYNQAALTYFGKFATLNEV